MEYGCESRRKFENKIEWLDLENKRILVSNKIYKGKQEALLLIPEAIKVVEQAKELAVKRGDTKLFSWKKNLLS